MVIVNKGEWDRSRGPDANHEFNRAWLAACQRVLKPNGSIWVSGTSHVIHSVGYAMQQLGFKLLNDISWVKPNPPPNLSCRYFTQEPSSGRPKDPRSKHDSTIRPCARRMAASRCKSVWQRIYPPTAKRKQVEHPRKSLWPCSTILAPRPTPAISSSTRSPEAAGRRSRPFASYDAIVIDEQASLRRS